MLVLPAESSSLTDLRMREEPAVPLMSWSETASRDLLRSYPARLVARGRDYAIAGRVLDVSTTDSEVHARVKGTVVYRVHLATAGKDALLSDCECPAFAREQSCKHVAALAWHLAERGISGRAERSRPSSDRSVPEVLRQCHNTAALFERLALYAGTWAEPRVPNWLPFRDWWLTATARPTPESEALRRRLLAHVPELEASLRVLQSWEPPPLEGPATPFADLYRWLAAHYQRWRGRAVIVRFPPGPVDDPRHPGFSFSYEAGRHAFVAKERVAPALANPQRLVLTIPTHPGEAPRLESTAAAHAYAGHDAWELFATREVLRALHAREAEAAQRLERDLGRPAWDRLLEQLSGGRPNAARQEREWAFCLSTRYSETSLTVSAFARSGKATKWKRQSFELLLDADEAAPLRDVARVAVCSLQRPSEAVIEVGTPQGHELLRLLAGLPNVRFATEYEPDPAHDPPARIEVGALTMRLEPAPNGSLSPRFMLGATELSAESLGEISRSGFCGVVRGTHVLAAQVPAPLRAWLDAAEQMGDALRFPPEAVPKLATTMQPLLASKMVEFPKTALGAELPYEPAPALRVEWRRDGAALVEILIAPHPKAPLIAPGAGPSLFTFESSGRRVFVERDLEAEPKIAREAQKTIDAPLLWDDGVGRTESVADAVALARYLEANPLGLAIEVKVGQAPKVIDFMSADRGLVVRKEGSWLLLDGKIELEGAKLTIGEVLEAARHARRFVRVGEGTFLELSKDVERKLRPVAVATELAGSSEGEPAKMNEAFGGSLAEAAALFHTVRGPDLSTYVRRIERGEERVAVPALDHGELRPYQREGVRWMLRLASWAPGCILADDMGLGKTVQTAAVLKARARQGPALIVAPASVASNWVVELARFMRSLKVTWLNEERISPSALGPNDVAIVSYGLLQRNPELFAAPRWATLVLDEAQYVKNLGAQRTAAARDLKRDFTIALTGTPLENHLGELYSIVDLAFPGLLGSPSTFLDRFRRAIETYHDKATLAALSTLLTPFLLRRTRASVLEELPPREEITELIDLAPDERRKYLALRRACELELTKKKKETKKGETPAQFRMSILAALLRLRQMACDARLVDPTFSGSATKIARAVEICVELAAEKNRALVFSQFTQFLDRVREALEQAGLRVAYLTGETPILRRRVLVDAFQEGEFDVFCVSLMAGGTGLNLTRASYVLHLDPWWNPAVEEQATSRAHRMGQTEPVTVMRIVSRGTIEEAVLKMHASKRELAAAVLEGKETPRGLTQEDLLELLRFGGAG
jgi:superfamily II DNA or RNA helicase